MGFLQNTIAALILTITSLITTTFGFSHITQTPIANVPLITNVAPTMPAASSTMLHESEATVSRLPQQSTVASGSPDSLSSSTAEDGTWKSYVNSQHGYEIQYPSSATISLVDSGSDPSTCVAIDDGFGYVDIDSGSSNPCGEPTGTGLSDVPIRETITIRGQQYSASGYWMNDNSYSSLSFGLAPNDSVFITYGVNNNAEPLTDADYQVALASAEAIVETLRLTNTNM